MRADASKANLRKRERFPLKNLVFIAFRPNFNNVGIIRDISVSGIGFEYLESDPSIKTDVVDIDIFSLARDFHISRVRCRIVYDELIQNSIPNTTITMRRCGLKIEHLNGYHSSDLKNLIKTYTDTPPIR